MVQRIIDGDAFKNAIVNARSYLGSRKAEVDALNVFPVPDGDTGTNMYLTLSSAAEAVEGQSGLTLGRASELVSHGALMGARGNSGVILSQILRGVSKYLAGKDAISADEIALALDEAVATAYKAVMKPVEGTILTVLRGFRDGARVALSSPDPDVLQVLGYALQEARDVLERTPDMLAVLRQAGVVDAGGKGLVFVAEGVLESLSSVGGKQIAVGEYRAAPKGPEAGPPRLHVHEILTADIEFPYDVQLLVGGSDISIDDLREKLTPLGDSLLVVGSGDLVRVHVHTDRPDLAIGICLGFGPLSDVTVDNMVEQAKAMPGFSERSRAPESPSVPSPVVMKEAGIVSVVTGAGLRSIMASLGCDLVIDGGPTMNPSTAELAAAVKTVAAKRIVFLPNNPNIFLAAKQAKKLVGRNMYIVPSKTVPQGISALLALNLSDGMSRNLKRASQAMKKVRTGEVTFAARTGRSGRHVMNQGDILGIIDRKVEFVGSEPTEALLHIVSKMLKGKDEIVTVYWGSDTTKDQADAALAALGAQAPGVEIEMHDGGHPLYYYIVSVE